MPINLLLRVLLFLVVLYILAPPEDLDAKEMEWLQKRIEFWRRSAEYCGNKVLSLEVKHAALAKANRMN